MYKKILATTFAIILLSTVALSNTTIPAFAEKPNHHKMMHPLKTIATVNTASPYILDVNKKTNKIYIANYLEAGIITVIDGKTNSIANTIPVGDDPNSSTVNEKTNRIYVTNYVDGTVSVIDSKTNSVIDTIPVGSGHLAPAGCDDFNNCTSGTGPYQAAVNEETDKIYVDTFFDQTISVIDGKTNHEVATIPLGVAPYGIAVNDKTNLIYVALNNTVGVIDGKTNHILTRISVGNNPLWVAVNENTNRIYVANGNDDTVSVIDGKTNTVIMTIPVPPGLVPANCTDNCTNYGSIPVALAVNDETNTVYVTDYGSGSISIIDGKTNKVIGSSISVGSGEPLPSGCLLFSTCTSDGSEPFAIAVNDETNMIYVLNLHDQTITVLDAKTHHKIGVIGERVTLEDLGVLQLVSHDLYNVNRTSGVNIKNANLEDDKLNLSTVLNYSQQDIANGGEPRNSENIIIHTVAVDLGQKYLDFLNHGKTPQEARHLTVQIFMDEIRDAYVHTFNEAFPKPNSTAMAAFPNDLDGDLALRTEHAFLPGHIMVHGQLVPILDPSLQGKTLDHHDMMQLSKPMDGTFDPAFRNITIFIPPNNTFTIDLLERDSSFATQFHTDFTFEHFLDELRDGKYDKNDDVMKVLRAEFASSQ